MAALASLIPELETALSKGTAAQRTATLKRVTDLFLQGAERYSEAHVELFDDVLSRLIVEIESRALAELARRLAPIGNAPIKVIRRLARDDDITVAGPVLLQSERLTETDLVEIAKSKTQAHLFALSGRPQLAIAVTDVLVGRGDAEVLRKLADNPGARFSEAGFEGLVRRASKDEMLAEKVGDRSDIPPHQFRQLVMEATEVVRKRLLAAARPETQAKIKKILNKVADEVGGTAAETTDFEAARVAVEALQAAGKLTEQQLVAFAKGGRYEETVAALACLSGVPIDVIDRLLSGDRVDPVLILCKSIGFGWSAVRAVIQVRAGAGGVSPAVLESALANFERLSFTTAQRVLRFWQVRHGARHDSP